MSLAVLERGATACARGAKKKTLRQTIDTAGGLAYTDHSRRRQKKSDKQRRIAYTRAQLRNCNIQQGHAKDQRERERRTERTRNSQGELGKR